MLVMSVVSIKWVAALVAAGSALLLAWVWYGVVFRKQWNQLQGIKSAKGHILVWKAPYFQSILLYLAMAVSLSVVMAAAGVHSWAEGLGLGVLLGVGLVGMTYARQVVFNSDPRLLILHGGFDFASIVVMSMVIGAWR